MSIGAAAEQICEYHRFTVEWLHIIGLYIFLRGKILRQAQPSPRKLGAQRLELRLASQFSEKFERSLPEEAVRRRTGLISIFLLSPRKLGAQRLELRLASQNFPPDFLFKDYFRETLLWSLFLCIFLIINFLLFFIRS